MALPIPILDNRRWADLMEEGRSLLPGFAPGWTDHNPSDPGMALLELLAYITEQHLYRLDQVTVAHRHAYLALAGKPALPAGPVSASVLLTPNADTSAGAQKALDAGVKKGDTFLARRRGQPTGAGVAFRATHSLERTGLALDSIRSFDGREFATLSRLLAAAGAEAAWGADPVAAEGLPADRQPALYLSGKARSGPLGRLSLWFVSEAGLKADEQVRSRLQELCGRAADPSLMSPVPEVVWEWCNGSQWRPASVRDGTRGLTQSGRVVLLNVAGDTTERVQIRCRLTGRLPSAPPRFRRIAADAVLAEQYEIVDDPAAQTPEKGTGDPGQEVRLILKPRRSSDEDEDPAAAIRDKGLDVRNAPSGDPRRESRWERQAVLAMSGRKDAHFVLDSKARTLRFGDGEKGRVFPAGDEVKVTYSWTLGAGGNVPAGLQWARVTQKKDSDGRSVFEYKEAWLANREAAFGGADAEELEAAERRLAEEFGAAEALERLCRDSRTETLDEVPGDKVRRATLPGQATTTRDLERLALDVPGGKVKRARAWAGIHPGYPGLAVPHAVTLVVVPELPARRPAPSPGLLDWLRRVLELYRPLGCLLAVVGPEYAPVSVSARLTIRRGQSCARARDDAVKALQAMLLPLPTDAGKAGWPFGRAVYLSDVQTTLRAVTGVEVVSVVRLAGADGVWGNGPVLIGPLGLPDLAATELEVVEGT